MIAFGAAFVAGAVNSVAGGGTVLTFPTLIWLGLPSVTANATNTAMVWPGSLGGVWGYWRELRRAKPRMLALVIPSALGGLAGALLLRWTPPDVFDRLVPFLILFATLLFMVQGRLKTTRTMGLVGATAFQFAVGVYGGYFGAGIGILMLAALGILGLTDIYEMNALKNFFALAINGIAALYFMWMHMVSWPFVLVMAVGAIAGGYLCAGVARRIGPVAVRRIVVAIGVVMAVSLFLKR